MFGFGKKTPHELQKERNKKLYKAAKSGDVKVIQQMLDEGADINLKQGMLSESPLVASGWYGRVEPMRVLLDRGADIHSQGTTGETVLILSAKYGYIAAVVFLLERGAQPDQRDNDGRDAAYYAARSSNHDALNAINNHLSAQKAEQSRRAADAAEKLAEAERKLKEQADARAQKQLQEVVTFKRQQGDLTVEDAFDFVNFERTTFVRRGEGGPVESVTRQEFSDIANSRALRRAFEEHVKRGGTTEEDDVFPDAKPKLPRPPGVQP